jgi:hypothetical protein
MWKISSNSACFYHGSILARLASQASLRCESIEGAMKLDAVVCDMLVTIVKEKTGAKDSRALPLNQAMTNVVGHLRADSLDLTLEQRRATRAISNGKIGTLKADVLEMLMRRDLLKYDGQALVLTAAGTQMADGSATKVAPVTCELTSAVTHVIGTPYSAR